MNAYPKRRVGSGPGQTTDSKIPARWKWHHRVLTTLRDRLIDDCRERLADAAHPIEPPSLDLADSATDDFDHGRALGLLVAEQDALCEVEAALKRIEKGTYGICEESQRPIPASRLKALPWTRYRKDVEIRMERARRIHQS
jgi:RNA polymerase-binding transcription factor DksA